MKKLFLMMFIAAGILLAANSGMAYKFGVGADFQTGGDFYKLATLPSGSTQPFYTGSTNGETLIPVPGIYPVVHLLLGDDNNLLDIGVGFAGTALTIGLGGEYTYFKVTEMFRFYGSGGLTYYIIGDMPGWTFLKLNSTILGLEVNLPVLPVSAYASGGLRFPMIFGPNEQFIMGVGWEIAVGARFYIIR